MRLVLDASCYTWIPAALYDSTMQRRYLEAVDTIPPSSMVAAVRNSQADAWLVYAADATLTTAFRVALPGIDCTAQPAALLTEALMTRAASHPLLLAYLSRPSDKSGYTVDYLAIDGGKMLLSVRRQVSDDRQLLYTSLSVMRQLAIEQPDMEMLLCGAIERDTFMQMRGYFPHLDLWNGIRYRSSNPQLARLHTYRYLLSL